MVKRLVCTLCVLREHELSESNLRRSSSPSTRRSWDDSALAARALTHRAISLTHKIKKKIDTSLSVLDSFCGPFKRMKARDGSDMSSSQVKQRITIVNSSSRESNMPLHTPRPPTLMCTPQPHTHTLFFLRKIIFRYFS